MWLSTPTYRLLLSDADPATMAQVVTRLKDAGVPYQIDEGGGGIRVPASRVDELRLEVLSQGLPESGRPGWEILDRAGFGVTDFIEKVNYRRALEGEIARTIASMSEVASARVHIAIGKDTLFGPPRPTTASVIAQAEGRPAAGGDRRSPASPTWSPSSVEGLRPESVVVVDNMGRPLAKPNADDERSGGCRQHRAPAAARTGARWPGDVAARAGGRRRARAGQRRAAARVGHQRGNPGAVGSRGHGAAEPSDQHRDLQQRPHRGRHGGLNGGAGHRRVPRQRPAAGGTSATPVLQPGPASSRNTETRNHEISRTTRRTVQPAGSSCAGVGGRGHRRHKDVIKNDNGTSTVSRTPRTTEELQKIQEIVSSAVGFDQERGDTVTVKNISFEETAGRGSGRAGRPHALRAADRGRRPHRRAAGRRRADVRLRPAAADAAPVGAAVARTGPGVGPRRRRRRPHPDDCGAWRTRSARSSTPRP